MSLENDNRWHHALLARTSDGNFITVGSLAELKEVAKACHELFDGLVKYHEVLWNWNNGDALIQTGEQTLGLLAWSESGISLTAPMKVLHE